MLSRTNQSSSSGDTIILHTSGISQSNPCIGLQISLVDQSKSMLMNLTWHVYIHQSMHIVSASPSSNPFILHSPACDTFIWVCEASKAWLPLQLPLLLHPLACQKCLETPSTSMVPQGLLHLPLALPPSRLWLFSPKRRQHHLPQRKLLLSLLPMMSSPSGMVSPQVMCVSSLSYVACVLKLLNFCCFNPCSMDSVVEEG